MRKWGSLDPHLSFVYLSIRKEKINYNHLKKEIDISVGIAQTFLNYKRGDISFDAFVMDALEQNTNSNVAVNDEYTRNFFEGLRDKPDGGSNSALEALLDYDSIFNSMDFDVEDEIEADQLWSVGSRYFSSMRKTLVA